MREHLAAFLKHLELNENASAHTVRAYDSDLSQLLTFLAAHLGKRRSDLLPSDFDHLHIRAFLGDLHKRGNSRSSAARKLAAIRSFGRYLRREGIIEGDPAALVGTPKREVRLPAHLGEAEMSRLLEMPDVSTPLGRRDRAILELFYASGLRLSELAGLDVDDLNLSSRVVRVLGKGRKERIVPFNHTTEGAVQSWLKDWQELSQLAVRPSTKLGTTLSPSKGRSSQLDRRGSWLEGRERQPKATGAAAVSELPGETAIDAQHRSAGAEVRRGVQHAVRDQPARAAAFLRHAFTRARRGPARDPGVARPRASQHHAALHACQRYATDGRLPQGASEGVRREETQDLECRTQNAFTPRAGAYRAASAHLRHRWFRGAITPAGRVRPPGGRAGGPSLLRGPPVLPVTFTPWPAASAATIAAAARCR